MEAIAAYDHLRPPRAVTESERPESAAISGGSRSPSSPATPSRGRVLVVSPQPFFEDRGTPIAVRQAVEALAELGYGVDLLAYPVGRDVALAGVRQFRVSNPLRLTHVPIGLSWRKIALDVQLIPELRNRLRADRYVAVHAVEEAAFPAIWLCRRRGIPVIYDMQSSLPEQLAQRAVFRFAPLHRATTAAEQWLLRNAALVVSSTGLAERVRAAAPRAAHREWRFHARTPPSAIEPSGSSLRAELGIPARDRVVLYTGSFETYQGLDQLLAAIPGVVARVPHTAFVCVGDTGKDQLGEAGRRLVAEGRLHVVSRRPRDEMLGYYASADVLVSPRMFGDNAPLKVFDYLAAGRPIVATDIVAHRALLADGRALLVAPRADAIAGAIVRVLEDPDLARELGTRALQYAEEHLGWDAFVRGVAEWYDVVLGPRSKEAGGA